MDNDTISRQAAIDAIEHITSSMSVCVNSDECHGMKRMQRQAVIELANLSSAQPERKKGKWIFPYETTTMVSICSECGTHGRGNFCPNCGADMRGERNG